MRKLFYLAFMTLIFTGCATKEAPNTIVTVQPSNIIIENDSIKRWFDIQNTAVLVRNDNLLEIELVGNNLSGSTQVLTYRIDWFDQNGFVIKSILTKWKIASVEAHKNLIIHAISPTENASSYKVRLSVPTAEDELRDKNVNVREYQGE